MYVIWFFEAPVAAVLHIGHHSYWYDHDRQESWRTFTEQKKTCKCPCPTVCAISFSLMGFIQSFLHIPWGQIVLKISDNLYLLLPKLVKSFDSIHSHNNDYFFIISLVFFQKRIESRFDISLVFFSSFIIYYVHLVDR